ncbi:hypothetical protein IAQ61_006973 [Plenodomus lingam]|uniref:uncharacterized protein n=1 Tax=Leptosphaeria maculans TaxID=5022 RepID=UPI003325450E|nr:hypothetical protein IAQ61_006973 [Plenodomus lingam]
MQCQDPGPPSIGPGKSLHADWSVSGAWRELLDNHRQPPARDPYYDDDDRGQLRRKTLALSLASGSQHSQTHRHTHTTMSGVPPSPRFFQQPLRYLHWASINKPAYFYSIIVGSAGPVVVLTVPPIRRWMGEEPIPKIPMTYPIPKGPRPRPTGFDDE